MKKTVIAAAVGECVHVAGITHFLELAESAGWRTVFLGPAVPIEKILEVALKEKADLVGVSYRLTPETGERLLGEFAEEAAELHDAGIRFAFGGTPPVAERVKKIGFFERVFDGNETPEDVLAYLRGQLNPVLEEHDYPQDVISRIQWKTPYPLLRHHFGLPTMENTIQGIEKIAEAKVLDVISLGIDQDAQENFFHPERQEPRRKGAGGVPVRSADDYRSLFKASRRGNFPLLRTYSGTDDFIKLAKMYLETIHNAWAAIPLFWFNQMDGRGPWDLEGSIREHQAIMQYYGERGIPVELNEPHHWGMRDAPDIIYVVSAFLAAYNARQMGVKDYIAQLMFNSPPGHSDAMDLAKMLAVLEVISPLKSDQFRIWVQTRTGLLSYPLDPDAARGHLASSIYLQMSLKPHIIHIVGHTEAHHAATVEDIIEAAKIARRAIENAIHGAPDPTFDPIVQKRKKELVAEVDVTLKYIRLLAEDSTSDPLSDPITLSKAITNGILDAPQLKNNKYGKGEIRSQIINGKCLGIDESGKPIHEAERIQRIFGKEKI